MIQYMRGKSRKLILILFDIACFLIVDAANLLLLFVIDRARFMGIESYFLQSAVLLVLMFVARMALRIYTNVWRYTNTRAYFMIVAGDILACALAGCLAYLFWGAVAVWHVILVSALTTLLTLMSRFTYRLLYKLYNRAEQNGKPSVKVAIVGAGQIGALLAGELLGRKETLYRPVFFVDCDREKVGSKIAGLPVYEENDSILERIKSNGISEIYFALSSFDNEKATQLYEFYRQTGCKIKVYDTSIRDMKDSSNGKNGTIRDFRIEDLLFRNPLTINDSDAFRYYSDKTVLVTGGGGSIGSELCRQIAKCGPKKLIILDIYENNAYDIQQELVLQYGDKLDLSVEIASVRDRERLEQVFEMYRPDIVFHAAAHKHVPLMEHSACEAIKNNVLGTYNTADMAEKYGVEKFILVSTDKAVNPTNVMGASKRLCEMIVQCRTDGNTKFAAVRFGNVLGSNGSVIPLFKRQIANGGPVTLTDKRIIRYFMTISEASQLVMQAGAMAKKGELFVLDMGKPVRIYDLAVNMIRLSGFEPDVDIKIEEIGLRPGEKLYEELLMKTETLDKTDNNMIFIERDTPLSRKEIEGKLDILRASVQAFYQNQPSAVKDAIKQVVPTFREPNEVNRNAKDSDEMKVLMGTQKQ